MITHDPIWRWQIMVTQQLCCSGLGELKTIILNVCGLSVYFHSLHEVAQKHNMKNDHCHELWLNTFLICVMISTNFASLAQCLYMGQIGWCVMIVKFHMDLYQCVIIFRILAVTMWLKVIWKTNPERFIHIVWMWMCGGQTTCCDNVK